MDNFRKKIKRRITLFTILLVIEVILGAYCFWVLNHPTQEGFSEGLVAGFQNGIILGLAVLTISQLIRLRRIVNDDTKLKILYNMEHDERLKTIRAKAGMPMLMITSIMMLVAAIIAGYYDETVFITLIIAATAQLTIGAIVKIYYLRTM